MAITVFTSTQELPLPDGASFKITDGGALRIRESDDLTVTYAPGAWVRVEEHGKRPAMAHVWS